MLVGLLLAFGYSTIGFGVFPTSASAYDTQRLVLLLFLGFVYFLLYRVPLKLSSANSFLIIILLLIQLALLPFRGYLVSALLDLLFFTFFSLTMLRLVDFLSKLDFDSIHYFLRVLVLTFFAYYLMILMQLLFFVLEPLPWTIHLLSPEYPNVRIFNHVQVLVFPICWYLAFLDTESKTVRIEKTFYKFCCVFTIAFLLHSNARGATLVVIGQSFLMIVLLNYLGLKPWRSSLKNIMSVWIIGISTFFILFVWVPSLFINEVSTVKLRTTSSGRFGMWIEALKLWSQNPIFGFGGMSYIQKELGITYRFGSPHNSVVQILFEYGLVGLSLITASVVVFFGKLWRLLKLSRSAIHTSAVISVIGGMVLSLASGVIGVPLSQLILFVLISTLAAAEIRYRSNVTIESSLERYSIRPLWSNFLGVLLFVSLIGLALVTRVELAGGDPSVYYVGPRFWEAGLLGSFKGL